MEGTGCKASYHRVSALVWVSQGTKCHPPKGGYVILLVCIVCTAYYGTRYQTLPWYLPKAVYKNASYNERYTRYVRLHTRCPGIRQAQGDGCPGVYHAELRGGCPPSLPPWWNRRPPPSGACVSALWPGGSLSTTAAGPSRGCQQPTPPPTRGTMHNLQVYTTQNMEVQKKRAAHSLVLQAGHKTPQYGTTLLPQRSFACHSLHASLWFSSIDHFHQSLQKTKEETKMTLRPTFLLLSLSSCLTLFPTIEIFLNLGCSQMIVIMNNHSRSESILEYWRKICTGW